MRTRDELFREARRRVAARRQRAVMQAEGRRRAALAANPALAQAETAYMRAGAALALAGAQGEALSEAQAALAAANTAWENALQAAGCKASDLSPAYTCPVCRDTGVANGLPCTCVAGLVRRLRREEINAASPLALCSFDSFDLTRYSSAHDPALGVSLQEYMGKILRLCRQYALGFSLKSGGMIFTGTAGLGKTHMALAIADTVLDRGFDVLYTSAAALVAQLGREQFDRDGEESWLTACKEADLLILDDLGTEYVTPLSISVLYELINTRMLCGRPTLYTSNITDRAVFEERYTEKVASRIFGSCKEYRFFGSDQRQHRR